MQARRLLLVGWPTPLVQKVAVVTQGILLPLRAPGLPLASLHACITRNEPHHLWVRVIPEQAAAVENMDRFGQIGVRVFFDHPFCSPSLDRSSELSLPNDLLIVSQPIMCSCVHGEVQLEGVNKVLVPPRIRSNCFISISFVFCLDLFPKPGLLFRL